VDADRDAFEDLFYAAVIGTTEVGVPAWEADATVTWDGTACAYDGPDPLPERLVVQVDNGGDEVIALVTGRLGPDATTADLEAFRATGGPTLPDWWTEEAVVGVPSGAHDVWAVEGGADLTALCYVGPTRFWAIAGPQLPE
jgi:hypothetical protein